MKGAYRQLPHFVSAHEACGPSAVAVDAVAPPGPEGYELSACCGCGATFQRSVSAEDTTLLVSWN